MLAIANGDDRDNGTYGRHFGRCISGSVASREGDSCVDWARRSFCGCAALKLAIRNFLVTIAITMGRV